MAILSTRHPFLDRRIDYRRRIMVRSRRPNIRGRLDGNIQLQRLFRLRIRHSTTWRDVSCLQGFGGDHCHRRRVDRRLRGYHPVQNPRQQPGESKPYIRESHHRSRIYPLRSL